MEHISRAGQVGSKTQLKEGLELMAGVMLEERLEAEKELDELMSEEDLMLELMSEEMSEGELMLEELMSEEELVSEAFEQM